METSELLKKVRKIEIRTKGLSNQIFSGEYHSAFKGRGMSFSEVREYQFGDDIRAIDWNVTARLNTPYIKVFEEERELTVMLIVDVSRSSFFGTVNQMKNHLIAEISAVLAFSASNNNDKVGLVMFSGEVNKYIPPKKGRSHILRIIRELLDADSLQTTSTDIGEALRFFNNVMKKKSISFLISDFMDEHAYKEALNIAAKRHDLVGVHISDPRERTLPNVGLLHATDAETGKKIWINTGSKKVRQDYEKQFTANLDQCVDIFKRSGSDLMQISTDQKYIKALMSFFKRRGAR